MVDPYLTDDEIALLQQLLSQSTHPLSRGVQAKLQRFHNMTDHMVALQVDNYMHKGFDVFVACEIVAKLSNIPPGEVRKIHKQLAKFEAKRNKAAKRLLKKPAPNERRRASR